MFQCSNLELLIFAFALRVTQWYSVCKAKSFFMMKQEKKSINSGCYLKDNVLFNKLSKNCARLLHVHVLEFVATKYLDYISMHHQLNAMHVTD